ncbi:BTB/POZ domain-containing protein [Tanacetum coccineum]
MSAVLLHQCTCGGCRDPLAFFRLVSGATTALLDASHWCMALLLWLSTVSFPLGAPWIVRMLVVLGEEFAPSVACISFGVMLSEVSSVDVLSLLTAIARCPRSSNLEDFPLGERFVQAAVDIGICPAIRTRSRLSYTAFPIWWRGGDTSSSGPKLVGHYTLFDVDTVQRVMMNYLEYELEGPRDDEYVSSPQSDMEKVGKLMESYLAEIASDRNLLVVKFITVAEHIPEQAKLSEDGMYRAIDIYLKPYEIK